MTRSEATTNGAMVSESEPHTVDVAAASPAGDHVLTASRRPGSIRQRDVTRAIKGVVAAGLQISRVEVANGTISVVTRAEGDIPTSNEWDETLP